MTEQALDTSATPTPSQPTPAPNPIEKAQIETPHFSQHAIQHAIAGHAATPHGHTIGTPTEPVSKTAAPTTTQSGPVTIAPVTPGTHQHIMQALIPNSLDRALNPYPSFSGPTASQTPLQPSSAPSNSYQTQPSSMVTPMTPSNAGLSQSTPSPTPQTPSSFFASSPAQTSPSSAPPPPSATAPNWSTPQQFPSQTPQLSQQQQQSQPSPSPQAAPNSTNPAPSQQTQQTVTTPVKESPPLGQLLSPQTNLQTGSIANHIQNVLAGIATPHHAQGSFPSQPIPQPTLTPNQSALSASPFVQIQPTSQSQTDKTLVIQPNEGTPPTAAPRDTQRPEQAIRERSGANTPELKTEQPTQQQPQQPQPGQTPPANNAALESTLRAISSLPAQESTLRSTPPPPPQPETKLQPPGDVRSEPTKPPTPPLAPDQREPIASAPLNPPQPPPGIALRPDQAPQQIPTQPQPQTPPTTPEMRVEPLPSNPKQQEPTIQPPSSPRIELPAEPRVLTPQSEATPQPIPQRLEQQAAVKNEQRQQENTEQRVERARDIQQIRATEREAGTTNRDRITIDTDSRRAPEREPSHIAVERIRESVLDSLTNIQSRLETLVADRQRLDDLRAGTNTRVQGRDVMTRPDPLDRDAQPTLITRLAERLHENQQYTRPIREPLVGMTSAVVAERTRIRHADSPSSPTNQTSRSTAKALERTPSKPERFSSLIDQLKRFSQRSVNFTLLNKMDTSLEKACLTIATGAAVGIVGIGFLCRSLNLAALHILGFLRDRESKEPIEESAEELKELELEQQLQNDLEDFTATELTTVGEQGFVVDLAGIVVTADSETPLASVAVNCAEHGTLYTDSNGLFLFHNLPLGAPYTITVSSPKKAFEPLVISGVCGELEFLKIRVNQTTIVA